MKDFDFYRVKYVHDGKWQIEFFEKTKNTLALFIK